MKRIDVIVIAIVVLAAAGLLVAKRVGAGRRASSVTTRAPSKLLTGAAFSKALKSGRPTMAEFGLGTCEVCRKMAPLLEKAAAEYAGKANIVSVDLDEYAALGRYYQIRAMPTQIFYNTKGEEVGRHVGFLPSEEIASKLAELGVK
jgi:thioredoxin 1